MKYIKCLDVSKNYGNNNVLKSFNCEFTNQTINFIIGSNGAGKSTLISCILEFIRYQGIIEHNLEKIVYQPEKVFLPDYMKVEEYLYLIGRIHREDVRKKIHRLIKLFGLENVLSKDLITLSKGMHQKVLLIQTLMISSDAYIFDEPLSGLDPISQNLFIEEIKRLNQEQKLVIIITHFIEQYHLESNSIIDLNHKEKYANY